MSKKMYSSKQLAGAFLAGAMLFSGFSFAAASPDTAKNALQYTAQKINYFVNGEEYTVTNGEYLNQGTPAPESVIINKTTYVPVRLVADLVGQPVYWDQYSRMVSLGLPTVKLYNADGEESGMAVLEEVEEGVLIKVAAYGLTPGKHGFHVHANPIEGLDFETAGGHFNPEDKHHGLEHPEGSHVGDMPNLEVKEDGTVEAEMLLPNATLQKNDPNSLLGRSLMIHAGEDDQVSDPSGNSGDRVVGGNIPE